MGKNSEKFNSDLTNLKESISVLQKDINYHNVSLFINTADIVFKYLDNELLRISLNRTKYGILLALINNGGTATPTELSNLLTRSKYTITGAVDSLEKEGLAIRKKINSSGQSDRRLRKIKITQQGLDIVRNSIPENSKFASSVMYYFSIADAQKFEANIRLLRKKAKELLNL
jgi:DNA-binding MarR family transcriptional regulator